MNSGFLLYTLCAMLVLTTTLCKVITWDNDMHLTTNYMVPVGDQLVITCKNVLLDVNATIVVMGELQVNNGGWNVEFSGNSAKMISMEQGSSATIRNARFTHMEAQGTSIMTQSATLDLQNVALSGVIELNDTSATIADSVFENVVYVTFSNLQMNNCNITSQSDGFALSHNSRTELNNCQIMTTMIDLGSKTLVMTNNTIVSSKDAISIYSSGQYDTRVITGNSITATVQAISISMNNQGKLTIQGNRLISVTKDYVLKITGSVSQIAPITFEDNYIEGSVLLQTLQSVSLDVNRNTFAASDKLAVLATSTSGEVKLMGNSFSGFHTALDTVYSAPSSIVVLNNKFTNGETVLATIANSEGFSLVFASNTVTSCVSAINYNPSIVTGQVYVGNNTFTSSGSSDQALIDVKSGSQDGANLIVTGNHFIDTQGDAIHLSVINSASQNKIYENVFKDTKGLSAKIAFVTTLPASLVIMQNVFNNPNAAVDLSATGYGPNFNASYNYWGTTNWDKITRRATAEHQQFIQSPFFMSDNVNDFSSSNIGIGVPVEPSDSHEHGGDDYKIALIIGCSLGGVAVVAIVAGVLAGFLRYVINNQKDRYDDGVTGRLIA